jgi:hypothetical protein
MPDENDNSIDYPAAAEQLIAILALRVQEQADRLIAEIATGSKITRPKPMPAVELFAELFGDKLSHLQHETKRRRIREIALVAREQLVASGAGRTVAADGGGYWLECDPARIAAYAAKRKRDGLAHLAAAAHQVKPTLTPAAGQTSLFESSHEVCDCGHGWITHSSAGCHAHRCSCKRVGRTLNAPIPKSQFRH